MVVGVEPSSLPSNLGGVLVWDGPRREGVLPAEDIRGNWNVTLVPADVLPGLGTDPGLKRRELERWRVRG